MSSKRRSTAGFGAAEEVAASVDLITEILLRLPVKPVLRFKLVSKQWLSLISDPLFASTHTGRNSKTKRTPSGLIFYDILTRSESFNSVALKPTNPIPPIETHNGEMTIDSSCNGLVIGRSLKKPGSFCVLNPTTNQLAVIPPPDRRIRKSKFAAVSLAFDPSVSVHYKVIYLRFANYRHYPVKCVNFGCGERCVIDIYSAEDRSWKAIDEPFQMPSFMRFDSGTYWNGSIHWATDDRLSVRFDVNSETLVHFKMPKLKYVRKGSCRYFGQSGDSLQFINLYHPSLKWICVFVLEKDYSGWVVKHRVRARRFVSKFPKMEMTIPNRWGCPERIYGYLVLCVVREEREIDDELQDYITVYNDELVLLIPGKVISYNFAWERVKVLRELPGEIVKPLTFNCVGGYQFIETLASVQP